MSTLTWLEHMTIKQEVMTAYCDCRLPFEQAASRRNLNFRASQAVTRDQAIEILTDAKVIYNDFRPELLKKFPVDCRIVIAREMSVAIYVQGGGRLPSASAVHADERDQVGNETRYWWD